MALAKATLQSPEGLKPCLEGQVQGSKQLLLSCWYSHQCLHEVHKGEHKTEKPDILLCPALPII